jgi:hypothetical protein
MLLTIPLNMYLLPSSEFEDQSPPAVGTWKLIKLPPVIVVCAVIIVVSNTWGFLDPTLEPHLREVCFLLTCLFSGACSCTMLFVMKD